MNTQPTTRKDTSRTGFTLIEVILVVLVLGVLLAFFLPNVRRSRGAARRSQCKNNLKQLCLALHNYHDYHGSFPSAMGGTGGDGPNDGNANRLSGLVALLPFIDEAPLWEQISAPVEANGIQYPAMGPAPWVSEYAPWQTQLEALHCASQEREEEADFGRTNYAFCIGDVARNIHRPQTLRGAFACRKTSRLSDITDGHSNTIAMAEIGTQSGSNIVGQFAVKQTANFLTKPRRIRGLFASSERLLYAEGVPLSHLGRGGCWADGAGGVSLVNTVLPPNSPSTSIGKSDPADGLYSAGSSHPGGIFVAMVDGRVRFVSDSIDVGNQSHATLTARQLSERHIASPYGVWGALGTSAGNDEVSEF